MASFLTGRHPRKTGGADLAPESRSIRVAAQRLGHSPVFRRLKSAAREGKTAASATTAIAVPTSRTWRGEANRHPLAKQVNPRLVFDRLFGAPAENEGAQVRPEAIGVRRVSLTLSPKIPDALRSTWVPLTAARWMNT